MCARAFGYARVSHVDSAESGLSIADQSEQIRNYYNYIKTRKGNENLEWGGIFEDLAQSAFKKTFLRRPESRALLDTLQDGDHVMFYRLDRGFRNVADLTRTVDELSKRDISIHFIDLQMDVNSANGRFFMHVVGAVAEWMSRVQSERIKGALAQLRKSPHRPRRGLHDWGFKIVNRNGRRMRIPDVHDRGLMKYCLKRHTENATIRQICCEVEAKMAAYEKRKPLAFNFQKFTAHMCRCAIASEIRLLAEEAAHRKLFEEIKARDDAEELLNPLGD